MIITCPECENQMIADDAATDEELAKQLPRCTNCQNLFDWSDD